MSELERLCKLCIDNEFSTGHADTGEDLAAECIENLLEYKGKVKRLEGERDEARKIAMEYASASQAKRLSEKYGIPPLPEDSEG